MNTEIITLESLDLHRLSPSKNEAVEEVRAVETAWMGVDATYFSRLSFPSLHPAHLPHTVPPALALTQPCLPPPQVKQSWDWSSYVLPVKPLRVGRDWSDVAAAAAAAAVLSTYYILFIHASVDGHWTGSTFWLLWTMLLWTWVYKYLFKSQFSIIWAICHRNWSYGLWLAYFFIVFFFYD